MNETRLWTSPPCPREKSTLFSNYSCIIIYRHVQSIKLLCTIVDGLNVHYITTSLHSKFFEIILWYESTRIIWMDYMLQIIWFELPPRAFDFKDLPPFREFHVPAMVLVEIAQLVVDVDRTLHSLRDCEAHGAILGHARVLYEFHLVCSR